MPTNDNDPALRQAAAPLPDAHGQAALLLVESLIHGLCERSTLSVDEAVAIVDRAANVQEDFAHSADGAAAPMWRSHAMLSFIAESLRTDRTSGPPTLRSVP